jgi:hypothetical protein
MGLLDEAIREHLELKRRRGADPGEIARQEREALGPARAPGETATAQGEDPPVAAASEAGEWEESPAPAVDEPGFDDAEEEEQDAGWDDADEPEEIEDADESATQVHEPAPRAAAPPAPAISAPDTGQPTSEYDVLGEDEEGRVADEASFRAQAPDEPADDVDDVLEETPEFLQETPEHDRLWFEQRPPRDFDFDG